MGGLLLSWRTAEPARVRRLLRSVGFRAGRDGRLEVTGLAVRVVGGAPDDRLAALDGLTLPGGGAPQAPAAPSTARLVAVGVATVDLEQAAGANGGPTRPLPADDLLGARVLETSARVLVLLEPATEGRLVATLARRGEGPAAIYVAVAGPRLAEVAAALRASGERPREGSGPFGRQVLAAAGPASGPHLLIVAAGAAGPLPAGAPWATIRPMIETDAALTFRDAEPADADWIAGLLSDEGYPAGGSDVVRRLERFAEIGSLVRIAERGGERLGFVAVHLVPRFEHDDRLARVIALVVDQAVRSRGIGHSLLDEVDRVAAEAGAAFVEVTAGHHRQDARRLFEAAGFDASLTTYLRKRR